MAVRFELATQKMVVALLFELCSTQFMIIIFAKHEAIVMLLVSF